MDKNGLKILQRERTIDSVLPQRWVGRWQAQGEEERPEVSAEAQRASVGRAQLLV